MLTWGKRCHWRLSVETVHQLSEAETSHIQQIIQGKKVFLIVDESEFDNKKFLNILVGNIETPEKTYLVDCNIIETVNQATVSTKIDDCLCSLQVLRENSALLSDAASYMRACSTTLKVLYPNTFHVTFLAHMMMHNCAERVWSYFTDVDNLIARVKAVISSVQLPSGRARPLAIYSHFYLKLF